jgi:hypothetical protein
MTTQGIAGVYESSRGIFERNHNPLAQRHQCSLNLLRSGVVLRVQHPPNHCFAHAEAPGKLAVGGAAFPDRQVQSQLWRKIKRDADEPLAAFGLRGWRNLVAAPNPPGNRFRQAVRGLHQRICQVVSSGERFG